MRDTPTSISPPSSSSGESQPQQSGSGATGSITPEMVNAIADKVYQMLLLELKYGRERHAFTPRRPASTKGGR